MASVYPNGYDDLSSANNPTLTHRNVAEAVEATQRTLGTNPLVPVKVAAATTGNISLSGIQNIDGVTGSAGQLILVRAQTLPANNGVYVQNSGSWTRATFANTAAGVAGLRAYAVGGTVNAGQTFESAFIATNVLGTDPIYWTGGTPLLLGEWSVEAGPAYNPVPNSGANLTILNWTGTPNAPVGARRCEIIVNGAFYATANGAGYWYLYKRIGAGSNTLVRQQRFHNNAVAYLHAVLDMTHEFNCKEGENWQFQLNTSVDAGGTAFYNSYNYMTLRYWSA